MSIAIAQRPVTGRSPNAATDRPWPVTAGRPGLAAKVDAAVTMAARGLDRQAIADRMGVSIYYVAKLAQESRRVGSAIGCLESQRVPLPPAVGQGDLSGREWQCAVMAARGMTNKAIAHRLGVSEATVKVHVFGATKKLRLHSRSEIATRLAMQWAKPADAAIPDGVPVVVIPRQAGDPMSVLWSADMAPHTKWVIRAPFTLEIEDGR